MATLIRIYRAYRAYSIAFSRLQLLQLLQLVLPEMGEHFRRFRIHPEGIRGSDFVTFPPTNSYVCHHPLCCNLALFLDNLSCLSLISFVIN